MNEAVILGALDIHLKELKMPGLRRAYRALEREAKQKDLGHLEFLSAALSCEMQSRQENRLKSRLKEARLPYHKTLADYNFALMPKLSKKTIAGLASADFVSDKHNAVLMGTPGTGKTHIAIATALSAVERGLRVRFTQAIELSQQLEMAKSQYRLPKFISSFDKYDLVVIDELGYLGLGPGGPLLFQFIANRYERKSVVITTNLEFARWTEIFTDPALTTALLDRLTHHCQVIVFDGDSYRLRESQSGEGR